MPKYIKAVDAADKFSEISGTPLCELVDIMCAIHAADVAEVVHGEWKLLDECSNAGVYCSICHKAVYRESAWYKNVHIKSKYCPNCGARMGKSDV